MFSGVIILILLLSLQYSHGQEQFSEELSGVPVASKARYKCFFTNLWTKTTHPTDYPDNPSWSAPTVVVHSENLEVWETGKVATAGMSVFARTGDNLGLTFELLGAGEDIGDIEIGSSFPVDEISVQYQNLLDFSVNQAHPYMTTLAKITPSPDWFTGFSELDLRQAAGDGTFMWVREFQYKTYPFTAGTQDGTSYLTPGNEVDVPIRPLTTNDSPFSNQPVAEWSCELLNESEIVTVEDTVVPSAIEATTVPTMDNSATTVPTMDNSNSIEPTMDGSMDSSSVETTPFELLGIVHR